MEQVEYSLQIAALADGRIACRHSGEVSPERFSTIMCHVVAQILPGLKAQERARGIEVPDKETISALRLLTPQAN